MKKIISGIILSAVAVSGFFLFPSINVYKVLPSNPHLNQGGVVSLRTGAVYELGLGAVVLKAHAQNIGTLQSIVTPGFSFKKDLMLGDTDPDVKELQRVLNADIDTMIISDSAGSRGKETTYFGQLTKDAVIKFQNKYKNAVLALNNITVADGKVNKNTRTRLNLLLGVMNTYDSVGLPQSRASTVVVTPAPVIVAAPAPQPAMSSCQFVELLISIGAISPDKANAGRSAFSCPTVATPFVVLKANNSESNITVNQNTNVTISWTSSGVTSCLSGTANKPLTGSEIINSGTASRTITMTCRSASGATVSDSISVNVAGTPPLFVRVSPAAGYSLVLFDTETNVPTKLYIIYRKGSASSQTASFTTLKTTRSEIVTGLTPNTDYYFKLKIVDTNGLEYISQENLIRTSNNPADDNFNATSTASTTPETVSEGLAQRVLYSSDGGGIVSIPGSESLKLTNKMTLEAWIKPTVWSSINGISRTKDQVIISKGRIGDNMDFALTVDNGKLVYSNNDASIWTCSSTTIPLNEWTHVAVSVDEATSSLKLFVNGNLISTTTPFATTTTVINGATTTVKSNGVICEGKRGVFNKLSEINKANSVTNLVESYIDSATTATDYSTMSIEQIMASVNASVSSSVTSNVYIGNFYPKMCLTSTSTSKNNGFIGSIDDVRIWKAVRTETEIKDNMKKSVKSKANLIGYYTFDDGFASDVSTEGNTGALKGSTEIIDDESSLAKLVGPEFSNGEGFTTEEPCYPPAVEPEEPGAVKNGFGGVVIKVNKCLAKSNLTEVVIAPCAASGKANTADLFSRDSSGAVVPAGNLSGNIKINIRDGMQAIPKVGDIVLGSAVKDGALVCTSLVGGLMGAGLPANPEQLVGTVTEALGISPAVASCPVPSSGGGGENWFQSTFNW